MDLSGRAAFVIPTIAIATLLATAVLMMALGTGPLPVLVVAVLWALLAAVVVNSLSRHDLLNNDFGVANTITTLRAGMTLLLAAFIPVAGDLQVTAMWVFTATAMVALALDGVDGYFARSRNECSVFGARFDMEIDAALALVISLLLWRSGEAGAWVLGLGLMRYGFIAASWHLTALRAPLFPSFRRKTICVIQIAALCAMLSPLIQGPWSAFLGLTALALVTASFARDTHWLLSQP